MEIILIEDNYKIYRKNVTLSSMEKSNFVTNIKLRSLLQLVVKSEH